MILSAFALIMVACGGKKTYTPITEEANDK